MFKNEDDYFNAIKDAQLYTDTVTKLSHKKMIMLNFLLVGLLSYATFHYLQNNTNIFSSSSLPVSKQAVLGVSETVDDSESSNARLMEILKSENINLIKEKGKSYSENDLKNSMKVLMNEPSIQSKSSYTDAIARELDDKSGFRGRIAVVNQETEGISK